MNSAKINEIQYGKLTVYIKVYNKGHEISWP